MIDCNNLTDAVKRISLVLECDQINQGWLRLATPFQYPDGANIDVFLGEPAGDVLRLSDLGQTTANLLDLHLKPWTSARRAQIVKDICSSLGVSQAGGEYFTDIRDLRDLASAIVR